MGRIRFMSPYLKGGKDAARLAHRTKYVATRPGVEVLAEKQDRPASQKQQQLIHRLLRDFPGAEDLPEYEDYLTAPTQGNANLVIQEVKEVFLSALDQKENYLDYIAHRPGVQLDGEHGLWGPDGKVKNLAEAVREVAGHTGTVWTPVVAIRREDAERTGYADAENWQALVKASLSEIAEGYKIPLEHLRWYAAFHEKEKQVHIHMVIFSSDPREGYLTKEGIREIRSAFARRIYQQELLHVYEQKDEYRGMVRERTLAAMRKVIAQMQTDATDDPALNQLVMDLSHRLRSVHGRKVYKYLPPDTKRLVDRIVEALASEARVAEAYDLWQQMREQICRIYSDQLPERVPLSKQKEFNAVRNMVIQEALQLAQNDDPDMEEPHQEANPLSPHASDAEMDSRSGSEREQEAVEHLRAAAAEGQPQAQYILSRLYRDGGPLPRDHAQFLHWLSIAAEGGNASAQYTLGRQLLEQGKDVEAVIWLEWSAAQKNSSAQYALGKLLLEKGSVDSALRWLRRSADLGNSLAMYRLGTLYLHGEQVKKQTDTALDWLTRSARARNQYAQYALGMLYLRGADVEKDENAAVQWLTQAAEQGNKYARFALDHRDQYLDPSAVRTVSRMLHHMSRIFEDKCKDDAMHRGLHIDRKRRKELTEKRLAMGHKIDDHEDKGIRMK